MNITFDHFFLKISLLSILSFFRGPDFYSEKGIKIEQINSAIQKGKKFLQNIQRYDGAICDTINPLFETWETVLVAEALYQTRSNHDEQAFLKAMTFLKHNENNDGLLCHNKKCSKAYCIETTSVYFQLLSAMGESGKVQKSILKIVSLQQKTGQWIVGNPDVHENKDFASVTAFALNCLHQASVKAPNIDQSLSWLLKKQTPEGDWGSSWEYYGITGYALWPIMQTLHDHSSKEVETSMKKAVRYILSHQLEDGSWKHKNSTGHTKQPSEELQTALMLSALAYEGHNNHQESFARGIDFLLKQQLKNGAWDGGYFPIESVRYEKKEYIFATSRILCLMNRYLDFLKKN